MNEYIGPLNWILVVDSGPEGVQAIDHRTVVLRTRDAKAARALIESGTIFSAYVNVNLSSGDGHEIFARAALACGRENAFASSSDFGADQLRLSIE